ncbi:Transcriptional regulatory protein ZraR [Planctomycetes bacterium Pla163]|uniref:Transcriptional regulatory protein ZraR n=1 Tax=Rohdeia mirabilis TaxID=2528008 RepID=A0A518CZF0_9BACT|nr:Transcriptional regulatory protein ZraR [Planctomycetes bacterium Pla163]
MSSAAPDRRDDGHSSAAVASSRTHSAQAEFQQQLERAAGSDATVLFTGESGSGKTRAAAALHGLGARRGGPFVGVHLGSLTPSLIESELFGHVRGAFTDAVRDRTGAFRRAQGGTLVLDDVDLLPLELQVKLLRTVQERVVEPVGSEAAEPIDVRLCATTNADLRQLVRSGRFREDLYFRLAVVVVHVPPLRARPDELPELVTGAVQRRAARAKVAPRTLTPAALERLAAHPWPGNVRELENALERVCALGPAGRPIEASEFDFLTEGLVGEERRIAREAIASGVSSADLEVAMIEEALEQQRGNVSAAARAVGLTRRALEYRLERAQKEEQDQVDRSAARRAARDEGGADASDSNPADGA